MFTDASKKMSIKSNQRLYIKFLFYLFIYFQFDYKLHTNACLPSIKKNNVDVSCGLMSSNGASVLFVY